MTQSASQSAHPQGRSASLAVFQADLQLHGAAVRGLLWEFLQWANAGTVEHYGASFDIRSMLDSDMSGASRYRPPGGRILLVQQGDEPAGIGCLRMLSDTVGELKRMYVRPAYRRQGAGRALLEGLLAEAGQIGYARVRLDSPHFMTAAHALYRSAGFREIAPYTGSEIPPEYRENWIFMERSLDLL